jgi:hypothetical protein
MLHFAAGMLTLALLGGLGFFVARLQSSTARSVWLIAFTVVVAGGVTMMVSYAFITRWGIRTDSPRDGLWAMMDGGASRPFVFRRLAPDIVRLVTHFVENGLPKRPVDSFLGTSMLMSVYCGQVLTRHEKIAIHVAYYVVWLAWLGTVVAGAALLRSVRACSWFEGLMTASLAVCLVPVTVTNGGYIYDSVEVFLWTALALCITRRWLLAVPPLFAAVLINKESALAAVPALFPLFAHYLERKKAAAWTVFLGAMAVAWLFFIRHKYAGNQGDAQEWSIGSNLAFWSRPSSYFKLAPMFAPGLPAPRGANIAILLLLLVPIRFGWKHVRRDVRLATMSVAVVMLPLMVVSGCMDETRVLGPLFPFVFIVCSEGLNRLFSDRTMAPV